MYFKLSYITRDFFFVENTEIKTSDPNRGVNVVLKQRPNIGTSSPPFEVNDGLIVATCERDLTQRLMSETIDSGVLSFKKQAVSQIFHDMYDCAIRTLRLVRWRINARGGPNPMRALPPNHFEWSLNGSDWKPIADTMSLKIGFVRVSPIWTKEYADFVQTGLVQGINEPLAHELLREAGINRQNRRSSLVLAVAAAEVGFKQFASRSLPDAEWLLELPSPPLTEMLQKFPWEKLKPRINGKAPFVPEPILKELKKAVVLRNKIVHSGTANLDDDTLDSILETVSDFLYLLDMLTGSGQVWASENLRPETLISLK
jgi:hypothetical protein